VEGDSQEGEGSQAEEGDAAAPTEGAAASPSPAEIAKDRAGLPSDFPQNVPTPSGGRLTTADTIGTGSERSWMASFTGTSKAMAGQCAAYATMLEGAGYQSVAGTADVGLALRGSSHDLTMLCGATSIDLIVNPRLV